ncbi:hypothetical protein Cri9333_2160 [Crinalium epipsammum PCC 9333]|uniref:Uncharacterized protein n=1 Tax=Crinalium epipsammum PCC 9333 TaxID=1173022 RepID=K9W0W3_9CYAN|nr:hypothetical protein [Crinalium epipsammum]AFZ13035.1 hypothetical protein Cri9333_2160 [Crinalium epipsammum PCC 9333]
MLKQQIFTYIVNSLTLLTVSTVSVIVVRNYRATSLSKANNASKRWWSKPFGVDEPEEQGVQGEQGELNLLTTTYNQSPNHTPKTNTIDSVPPEDKTLENEEVAGELVFNRSLILEVLGVFLALSIGLSLVDYLQNL